MSVRPKRMLNQAISVRSSTPLSIRDKDGQITEGRFEGYLFDANPQTESKLLQEYLRKSTRGEDIQTEPVKFMPEREIGHIFVQTEPPIFEPELTHEPVDLDMPAAPTVLVF